jgi:hypothetical protein
MWGGDACVARGWGWDRLPARWEPGELDAGDASVPSPLSPTPAPTEFDGLLLRLTRIGADQAAVGAVNRVHDHSAPTADPFGRLPYKHIF